MKILSVIAALLLVAACSSDVTESPSVEAVALVTIEAVTAGAIAQSVTLYGAAENGTAEHNDLSVASEAVLDAIETPVGTRVERGQVVARLLPSPASRLDLRQSETDLTLAAEALARAERLRADGLASDADVEAAHAAVQSSTATRDSLAVRLGALVLRAPQAGYIASITPSIGDLVPAGSAVATITHSGGLRARFGIDPALARRLGQEVGLKIRPSAGGAAFLTTARSIDPMVDTLTQLASLYADLPPDAAIGAGETLLAEAQVGQSAETLTVPYAALLDDAGQAFVYVVIDDRARRREVVIGPADGDRIAIVSGLALGESVVTGGGTALQDGMRIRRQ